MMRVALRWRWRRRRTIGEGGVRSHGDYEEAAAAYFDALKLDGDTTALPGSRVGIASALLSRGGGEGARRDGTTMAHQAYFAFGFSRPTAAVPAWGPS